MKQKVIRLVPKKTVIYEKDGFQSFKYACGCVMEKTINDVHSYYLEMCMEHEDRMSEMFEDLK